jgi:hypothetical protein
MKKEADMLGNPCKATKYNYVTHKCKFNDRCILQKGWLAKLEGYKVSLAGLFHPESFRDFLF